LNGASQMQELESTLGCTKSVGLLADVPHIPVPMPPNV
jgi:hypothetical protein